MPKPIIITAESANVSRIQFFDKSNASMTKATVKIYNEIEIIYISGYHFLFIA